MFDFSVVTHWVDQLLRSFLPEGWAILTEFILIGLCLLVGYAVIALVLIYVERKVCAFFQCRLGPNRVGPYGLIQCGRYDQDVDQRIDNHQSCR